MYGLRKVVLFGISICTCLCGAFGSFHGTNLAHASAPILAVGAGLSVDGAEERLVRVQGSVALDLTTDDATGIRLGIPAGSSSRTTNFGRNWKTQDGRLDIDTFRFTNRSLQDLSDRLRGNSGRTFTRGDVDKESLYSKATTATVLHFV